MGRKRQTADVLSPEEREIFLTSAASRQRPATGRRNYAMFLAMLEAGLRSHEVVALKKADLRWANGSTGILIVRNGKGDKYREVPMSRALEAALRSWLDHPKKQGNLCRSVFSPVGASASVAISTRTIRDATKKQAVKAFGSHRGKEIHPHTLRHTFASVLLEDGATVREVQDLLGHASPHTTLKIYCASSLKGRRRAVERSFNVENFPEYTETDKKMFVRFKRFLVETL